MVFGRNLRLGDFISTDKKYKRFLLLGISAILTGITLVFPKVGFLEWITLIPAALFLLLEAANPERKLRSLYGYGLFFFMLFYAVNFHWFIALYPLDFIDGMTPAAALAVVFAGCVGLSFLQALFGGFLFVLLGTLFRTRAVREHKFLAPILLATTWSVYEWTQTLGWWGVPWARLPLGQSEYLVGLQTASLFGSYFISFSLVFVNSLAAFALINRKNISCIRFSAICAAAVLIFQYGAGAALYFAKPDEEKIRTVKVAAIQGNISSKEKWSFGSLAKTMDIYEEYTVLAAEQGAKIVVWPETVIPHTITEKSDTYKQVSSIADENDIVVLVGAFSPSETEDGDYNSIFCFLPDGSVHEEIYAKRRLVPFGEFVPMRTLITKIIPPLAELVLSDDDVISGEGAAIMDTKYGNIGSLICFDSIYEELTRDSVISGAQVICLSTNDSWFGDSAAVYMHNAQAQIRAIENGRCIVRSANTGISTVIDSKGNIKEELEPLVDGFVVSEVTLESDLTLYTVIGNSFIYLSILAYAYFIALEIIDRIKNKALTNSQT